MENVEEIFDKKTVEDISTFVEKKMELLQDVKEFKQRDQKLLTLCDDFESSLSDELKEKYKDIMKLNFQIDRYYLTLSFFLGAKFSNKIKKLQNYKKVIELKKNIDILV